MKLIVELTNKNLIKDYKKIGNISYLTIGYKGLSFNSRCEYSIEEIDEINNLLINTHIKLILNAERLFSDNDLNEVKKLIDLGFFNKFAYVMYSDFGFKNLLEKFNKNVKFILKAPTYLTNAMDVNEYRLLNDYVVLSSEISSDELIELSKKVNEPTIIDLFGQSACFYSRRGLISNYFKYREINDDATAKNFFVVEELRSDYLPIIESEIGTIILEPKFHALTEEVSLVDNADFGLISLGNLSQKKALTVVKIYDELLNGSDAADCFDKLKNELINVYKGAYNIKSVLLKGGCNE